MRRKKRCRWVHAGPWVEGERALHAGGLIATGEAVQACAHS